MPRMTKEEFDKKYVDDRVVNKTEGSNRLSKKWLIFGYGKVGSRSTNIL